MRQVTNLVMAIAVMLLYSSGWTQTIPKRDRFPSYFGLTASPVIPNNFVGEVNTAMIDTNTSNTMFCNFKQQWGYTFGATVRIGITKTISIETGIAQVHRNFLVTADIPDSNLHVQQQLTFVNYDVPINGLFYVQLSENTFMNAAFGASITQYPSDIVDTMLPASGKRFDAVGRRIERTHFAINGGLGFEYRTRKSGTFYLGGGVKIPFKPIFFGEVTYNQTDSQTTYRAFEPIKSGYFTLDVRYFFPQAKKKPNVYSNILIE